VLELSEEVKSNVLTGKLALDAKGVVDQTLRGDEPPLAANDSGRAFDET
jgi:hypothetical protein